MICECSVEVVRHDFNAALTKTRVEVGEEKLNYSNKFYIYMMHMGFVDNVRRFRYSNLEIRNINI